MSCLFICRETFLWTCKKISQMWLSLRDKRFGSSTEDTLWTLCSSSKFMLRVLLISVDNLNDLLVYPHITLISCLFLRKCFLVQVNKSMSKVLRYSFSKFLEDAHFVTLHQIINETWMIHIVIEKVNKLLAYPQKTFGGCCNKIPQMRLSLRNKRFWIFH